MRHKFRLIEDNDQNRYLATLLLEKRGHEVASAVDGPSGIEQASKLQRSLILLDIQLPKMSGYSVAWELRQTPVLAAIPVVEVIFYAMLGNRKKTIAAGCNGELKNQSIPLHLRLKLSATRMLCLRRANAKEPNFGRG
jgi:CheY-like chemotaxis protein